MSQLTAAIKWINALKGYKGRKTVNHLSKGEGHKAKYCCLGVGCKVNRLPMNYDLLQAKVGLQDSFGEFYKPIKGETSLAALNDDTYSNANDFKMIRKHILSRINEIFVPEVAKGLRKAKKLGQI